MLPVDTVESTRIILRITRPEVAIGSADGQDSAENRTVDETGSDTPAMGCTPFLSSLTTCCRIAEVTHIVGALRSAWRQGMANQWTG